MCAIMKTLLLIYPFHPILKQRITFFWGKSRITCCRLTGVKGNSYWNWDMKTCKRVNKIPGLIWNNLNQAYRIVIFSPFALRGGETGINSSFSGSHRGNLIWNRVNLIIHAWGESICISGNRLILCPEY